MKVQANPEPLKLQSQPPLINTPAQSSLSPFDKNYTLTGLIKHIESSLTELIQTKRATMSFQIARQHSEVQKLMKIKEEVGVLKTLIIYNINEIFSNIYPSDKDDKKLDKTNHTHSPDTFKNDQLHHKEMTITQFEVQKLNDQLEEIISFQVNNEKIVHKNIIQSEEANQDDEPLLLCDDEDEDERTKVEKERLLREITPFYLRQMENRYEIKIEEDQDDQLDLFCYQDEKVINGRKQRKQIVETRQDKGFSPILQRPVEEQQTMQKQVKNEVNVTLSQKQKPIFGLTAITQAEVKRRLFTYINRPVLTQRYSTKRYIYLEKGRQK